MESVPSKSRGGLLFIRGYASKIEITTPDSGLPLIQFLVDRGLPPGIAEPESNAITPPSLPDLEPYYSAMVKITLSERS